MKFYFLSSFIYSLYLPTLSNLSNLRIHTVLVTKLEDLEQLRIDLLSELVLLVPHQVVDILIPSREGLSFLYSLKPLLNLQMIG